MSISIVTVLKQSAKFNTVEIIGKFISIPQNIIIATLLTPKDYGVIGFLGLWTMYSGLINPGILSAGQREIPYLLGKDEKKEALRIQNISISADLLYSLLPFLVILFSSFFFSNPIIKMGLIISAFSFIFTRFVNYWKGINFIRQNFTLVAKGNLITSISSVIIISVLIYWMRIYAVLIAPIIVSLILGVYYWKKGDIGYRFEFDWSEIKRMAKVGIVLALGTLAFWGYKMADRTIIAAKLPLRELGLYAYAMSFIMLGWNLFADFGRVLQPIMYENSGKVKNVTDAFSDAKRIAVYLALATAVAISLSQVCFYLLVNLITTKYLNSVPIFYVLSCNLYLASIVIIPGIILNSKVVNKQALFAFIYGVGLGLNIIFDLFAIHLGYGIIGVAWVTVSTQGFVTFLLYFLVKRYLFTKIKKFIPFIASIVFPFSVSILFTLFHNFLGFRTTSTYVFVTISLLTQIIIWGLVITIFYRKYFPKEKILKVTKEFVEIFIKKLKRECQ